MPEFQNFIPEKKYEITKAEVKMERFKRFVGDAFSFVMSIAINLSILFLSDFISI